MQSLVSALSGVHRSQGARGSDLLQDFSVVSHPETGKGYQCIVENRLYAQEPFSGQKIGQVESSHTFLTFFCLLTHLTNFFCYTFVAHL